MQGRLTDTPRERDCRRLGASRLRAARPEARRPGRPLRPSLLPDEGVARRSGNEFDRRRPRRRQSASRSEASARSSIRTASAPTARCEAALVVRRLRHRLARARPRRLSRSRSRGRIVAHPRSRAGRQRSGQHVRRRGHRGSRATASQGARRAGEGRHRRHLRRGRAQPDGTASNFQAQAANYWPATPPRVERYTLKAWSDACAFPSCRCRAPVAERLVAPSGRSLLDLARSAETRGGVTPVPLNTLGRRDDERRSPHGSRSQHRRDARRQRSDAQERIRRWSARTSITTAPTVRASSTAPTTTARGRWGWWRSPRRSRWRRRRDSGRRRSVIFAAWNSEERGLLGAWAYTEDPIVPLDRIVAVLNMDMIGRDEEVPVGGGGAFPRPRDCRRRSRTATPPTSSARCAAPICAPRSRRPTRASASTCAFATTTTSSNLMRRSDHWPFIQRGVPGVWVHTGLHPDYHTLYDRPEKINYPKMEKIARLVYQAAWDLANGSRASASQPGCANERRSSADLARRRRRRSMIHDLTPPGRRGRAVHDS